MLAYVTLKPFLVDETLWTFGASKWTDDAGTVCRLHVHSQRRLFCERLVALVAGELLFEEAVLVHVALHHTQPAEVSRTQVAQVLLPLSMMFRRDQLFVILTNI